MESGRVRRNQEESARVRRSHKELGGVRRSQYVTLSPLLTYK